MRFWDDFPLFYETGNVQAGERLNARFDCLIRRNAAHIESRTLLDVGSHDGRWSFAALEVGASHVTGIEPRRELVATATATMDRYGVPAAKRRFIVGDALESMAAHDLRVDTVLLLGVLYHVDYHVPLVREIWRTGASAVVVDSEVSPDAGVDPELSNTISLSLERVDSDENAANEHLPGSGLSIVGHPSPQAIRFLFDAYGFDVTEIPWEPYLERWGVEGLEDYSEGRRRSFLALRRDPTQSHSASPG